MSKLKSHQITGKKIRGPLFEPEVLEILKSQKSISKASVKTKKYTSTSNEIEDEEEK